MVGLGAIVICFLYILIAAKLVRKLPSMTTTERNKKIVSAVVWFAVLWLPVTEPAISYVAYKVYAYGNAGPKIFRTVANVDRVHVGQGLAAQFISIRWNPGAFSVGKEDRNSMAYDYVECEEGGKIYEESYETGWHGRIVLPVSKSQYFVSGSLVPDTRYYSGYEYKVYDKFGDTLATCQYVSWRGGGFQKIELLGRGSSFDKTPENYHVAMFVHSVLKPRIAK